MEEYVLYGIKSNLFLRFIHVSNFESEICWFGDACIKTRWSFRNAQPGSNAVTTYSNIIVESDIFFTIVRSANKEKPEPIMKLEHAAIAVFFRE